LVDTADQCGKLIKHLEDALAITDELADSATGYLIERELDEARESQFRPTRDTRADARSF